MNNASLCFNMRPGWMNQACAVLVVSASLLFSLLAKAHMVHEHQPGHI